MSTVSDESTGSHPTLALAAYAGGLLAGRRVAVLGDSATALAQRVAELTGRRVHAYDPLGERAAAAIARGGSSNVSHAPLDEALGAHQGAFDAVILADRGARSLGELVELASSLLSARGFLLLASPNPEASQDPDAPGYYELYDIVAAHFDHVRMLGQAPFVGYTVAEFALEGEPAVTIDSSLVTRSEEPRYFLALASTRELGDVEPYTLVQMPLEGLGPFLFGEEPSTVTDVAALAEARLRLGVLESELERAKEREREARQQAKERQAATTALSARLAELEVARDQAKATLAERLAAQEREVDKQRRIADDATRRARAAEERAAQVERDAERDADGRGRENQRRESQLAELHKRIEHHQARARAAEERAEAAEAHARAIEKKLGEPSRGDERHRAEIAKLEGALARARRDHQKALEDLEEAHQEELDRMLERIAELEGGAELEENTEPGQAAEEVEAPSPNVVRGLEFQIEELKKSLSQARAERDGARDEAARTGAELDRARLSVAARPPEPDVEIAEDLERLETQLKERGRKIAALEAAVREAERIGRELVRRLDGGAGADVAALAQRCSRCEADLQAARWKIASLEAKTDDRAERPDEAARLLEDALRQSQAEIAELRRALERREG